MSYITHSISRPVSPLPVPNRHVSGPGGRHRGVPVRGR